MDVYVAVVIVVSILGFAIILAITWLVYKWYQQPLRDQPLDGTLDDLAPTQRLVVEHGKVIPRSQKRATTRWSVVSSVRYSVWNKSSRAASIHSKRSTRATMASDLEGGRQRSHSRASQFSTISYGVDEVIPPLPGMPPQIATMARPRVLELSAPASVVQDQKGPSDAASVAPADRRHSAKSGWSAIPEESLHSSPVSSRSNSTNQAKKSSSSSPTPPVPQPHASPRPPPLYTAFDDGATINSNLSDQLQRSSLRSKYHVSSVNKSADSNDDL